MVALDVSEQMTYLFIGNYLFVVFVLYAVVSCGTGTVLADLNCITGLVSRHHIGLAHHKC